MTVRIGIGLTLLLFIAATAGACTGYQPASPTVTRTAGDLTGVRIDVHEAPD